MSIPGQHLIDESARVAEMHRSPATTDQRPEALRLADALELNAIKTFDRYKAVALLRSIASTERPAQQAAVAWISPELLHALPYYKRAGACWGKSTPSATIPLYTGPSQPLQPLTDEQIDAIELRMLSTLSASGGLKEFARAIERAHGIPAETATQPESGTGGKAC